MGELYPPADAVAAAIVAAWREMGNPRKVAHGAPAVALGELDIREPFDHTFAISRTRAYAALALRRVYPECPRPTIARLVGASKQTAPSLLSAVESGIARGTHKWLVERVLARVVSAIEALPPEVAPIIPENIPEPDLLPDRVPMRRRPSVIAAPYKPGPLPMHDARKFGRVEAPVEKFTRVLASVAERPAVQDGLARRAVEKRLANQMLEDAARNTANMQQRRTDDD